MLTEYKSGGRLVWVDLYNPSSEEIAAACDQYQIEIPPRDQLDEIEFSSRLQYEDGVFTISVPVTPHRKNDEDATSPLGFVLTKDLLVTVRFAHLHTMDAILKRMERRTRSAPDVFMVILEALIDYGADRLEELRAGSVKISRRIFHKEMQQWQRRKVSQVNAMLRDILVEIGDIGERLTYIRDTLLVLQRAVPFVTEQGNGWLEENVRQRLKVAAADVQSLSDYEVHLKETMQFLLDADLGFINTEQNDLFKVMTVWSVAGIPPVLFAGIWGMNFHFMPELSWPLGYPLALGSIVLVTVIPLLWFKFRGWW